MEDLAEHPGAGGPRALLVLDFVFPEAVDLAFPDQEQLLEGDEARLLVGEHPLRPGHQLVQHGDAHDLDVVGRDHVGVQEVRICRLLVLNLLLLLVALTRARV